MVSTLLSVAALISAVYAASVEPRAASFICPGARHIAINPLCCPFYDVADDLVNNVFDGICGENAHSTVRIAFHDAIGFSTTQNFGGGADGSIILFGSTELAYAANAGIDDIVGDLQPLADAHKISYGDVIQFGSSVALGLCPGAPLVKTFVGRKNATAPAPDHTVPEPTNTVQDIISRMADGGFSSDELVALLSSHSIAAQDEIEPQINGASFDTTPSAFDTQIFLEVLLKGEFDPGVTPPPAGEVHSPVKGEFRLESDANIARFSTTACTWQNFINQQAKMTAAFGAGMAKIGLTGQNSNNLIDCTEAVPRPPAAVNKAATYPAGQNINNVQQACTQTPFPSLSTDPGPATSIGRVPPQ